ncbi:MAG: hypothetical protein A3J38_06325 [Gammaproteobacteria bacterium RIFCSPHIGHO2_12_FULL_45_9]|nr:MAG: hypothetical protein A3J38_06325 [Gammaproteobacteria bacterium RIFCSPHIGHO2_12_FULL_45_9]
MSKQIKQDGDTSITTYISNDLVTQMYQLFGGYCLSDQPHLFDEPPALGLPPLINILVERGAGRQLVLCHSLHRRYILLLREAYRHSDITETEMREKALKEFQLQTSCDTMGYYQAYKAPLTPETLAFYTGLGINVATPQTLLHIIYCTTTRDTLRTTLDYFRTTYDANLAEMYNELTTPEKRKLLEGILNNAIAQDDPSYIQYLLGHGIPTTLADYQANKIMDYIGEYSGCLAGFLVERGSETIVNYFIKNDVVPSERDRNLVTQRNVLDHRRAFMRDQHALHLEAIRRGVLLGADLNYTASTARLWQSHPAHSTDDPAIATPNQKK